MEELVIRLNIERYRKILARDDEGAKQRTLLRLLAEEEAKLAAIEKSCPLSKSCHKTNKQAVLALS